MLAMLTRMNYLPTGAVAPADFARHDDARVRREAIAMWLRVPAELDRAIIAALKDADERVLRLGVTAAQRSCPEAAVPLHLAPHHTGAAAGRHSHTPDPPAGAGP